jgi:hypothetical protein
VGKRNNKQSGFSAVEVILVIILILCLAGMNVLKHHIENNYSKHNDKGLDIGINKGTKSPVTANSQTPYAGWKSYCSKQTGDCFKYPAEWGFLDASNSTGANVTLNSPDVKATVTYASPYSAGGAMTDFVASVDQLGGKNANLTILGVVRTSEQNYPAYFLVDSSFVKAKAILTGHTYRFSASDSSDSFTGKSGTGRSYLYGFDAALPANGTLPLATAKAWFSSSDGETELQIMKSFYRN